MTGLGGTLLVALGPDMPGRLGLAVEWYSGGTSHVIGYGCVCSSQVKHGSTYDTLKLLIYGFVNSLGVAAVGDLVLKTDRVL